LEPWVVDAAVVIADTKLIECTAGDEALSADAGAIEILDRNRVAFGSPKTAEEANATILVFVVLVQKLVEIVIDGPASVTLY
jgi:hypothetical protein